MIRLSFFRRRVAPSVSADRPGYIFLISVLFIGSISVATVASLLLLGWAAEQNGKTFAESTQALEMAKSCLELGVQNLREDLNYAGDETITFSQFNNCTLLPIQGSGNSERIICSEGNAGPNKKRIKMVLVEVLPVPIVSGYEEMSDSNDCNPADPVSSSSMSSGSGSSIAFSGGSSGASSAIAFSSPPASSAASSSVASSAPPASSSSCGNGILDPGEECDDGNTIDDACTSSCQVAPGCSCTNDPMGFPVTVCQACAPVIE